MYVSTHSPSYVQVAELEPAYEIKANACSIRNLPCGHEPLVLVLRWKGLRSHFKPRKAASHGLPTLQAHVPQFTMRGAPPVGSLASVASDTHCFEDGEAPAGLGSVPR